MLIVVLELITLQPLSPHIIFVEFPKYIQVDFKRIEF